MGGSSFFGSEDRKLIFLFENGRSSSKRGGSSSKMGIFRRCGILRRRWAFFEDGGVLCSSWAEDRTIPPKIVKPPSSFFGARRSKNFTPSAIFGTRSLKNHPFWVFNLGDHRILPIFILLGRRSKNPPSSIPGAEIGLKVATGPVVLIQFPDTLRMHERSLQKYN